MVVHGRDRTRAEATAEEIRKSGGRAAVTIGDFELDEDAHVVATNTLKAFDGIDILINNAGLLVRADSPEWTTVPASDWLRSFNVNVSAVRLSQKLAPPMMARGGGRIINFASVAAISRLGSCSSMGPRKPAAQLHHQLIAHDCFQGCDDGEHHCAAEPS